MAAHAQDPISHNLINYSKWFCSCARQSCDCNSVVVQMLCMQPMLFLMHAKFYYSFLAALNFDVPVKSCMERFFLFRLSDYAVSDYAICGFIYLLPCLLLIHDFSLQSMTYSCSVSWICTQSYWRPPIYGTWVSKIHLIGI